MSIIKNLEIKISNGEARLNEEVYVYQKDRGVELKLKLNLMQTNYRSAVKSSLFGANDIYAAATILKPNGDIISRKKSIVVDSTITFTIDKEFTDEVDEIGIYKIQFHLYDNEDNRVTIPPIQFEVKELLGLINEDDVNHDDGIVDVSSADYCNVVDDGKEMELFVNGRYFRTVWSSGDLITSVKLNKIEEAIEYLDNRLSEFISSDNFVDVEKVQYTNDSDVDIQTVKDALDKLLYKDLSISLSCNVPTILEKGRAVEGIIFSWNYDKKVTSQILNNQILDLQARNYLYNSYVDSDKTFTLISSDGVKSFSKSISFTFLNGVYYGTTNVATYNNNFMNELSKELSPSRNMSFNVNCKNDEYIYYCIPVSYGTPTFTVGGFVGGFNKVEDIEFENTYGYTERYSIYKSTNKNLGNTTVVVS